MTRLWNTPEDFADEMIDGFVAANGRYVARVRGGVVRSTVVPHGQVAVVIGGGSGHYPAFGGLVGPGLAHGAAMGNLFASPSAQQIEDVAMAANVDGGVLLAYGNYAGDALNFDVAQERLRQRGVSTVTVRVTDDIASAPPGDEQKRRGVAGDLTVFRIAGAAAEEGYPLADVHRIASLANERTRTFGVAFSGCTLPGASGPLFSVPEGQMALGLGIHGEPGLQQTSIPTADELAELLVVRLLAEAPQGESLDRARVVPILNGLGSVKSEEMFVVFRRVAQLLEQRGIKVIDPHVGEYCTSFDMAGLSLTLFYLNEELEHLWMSSVDTPAYRRGSVAARASRALGATDDLAESIPESEPVSREVAAVIVQALETTARTIEENAHELGRIDSIAGDGDHGIGMQRGSRAAVMAARGARDAEAGAATTLRRAANSWADRAGGTSGILWGVILNEIASKLGDSAAPSPNAIAEGIAAAARGVMSYGKAKVGDKTLVDALVPFSVALGQEVEDGTPFALAWTRAAAAATKAADQTAELLPQAGRARTHGSQAVGTPDPGAVSLALVATAVGKLLSDREEEDD